MELIDIAKGINKRTLLPEEPHNPEQLGYIMEIIEKHHSVFDSMKEIEDHGWECYDEDFFLIWNYINEVTGEINGFDTIEFSFNLDVLDPTKEELEDGLKHALSNEDYKLAAKIKTELKNLNNES
ncbi:MAG: hypothetical protein ACE1ZQ_09390 [Ignavibacteriaceae bacterium]